MDDVLAELRKRFTDPSDLAKFERFAELYGLRMTEIGPDAGVPAMMETTWACWLEAFGAEWPAIKVPATKGDR